MATPYNKRQPEPLETPEDILVKEGKQCRHRCSGIEVSQTSQEYAQFQWKLCGYTCSCIEVRA